MIEKIDIDINIFIVYIFYMFKKVEENVNVMRREIKLLVVKNIIF